MNSSFWPSGPRAGNISVTAILDDAFTLLKYHYALVLTAGALFIVPLTLLSSYLTDRVAPNVQAHTQHFVDLSNQIQAHGSVPDKQWNSALAVVIKDYAKIFAVSGGTALLQACLVGTALAVAVCTLCLDRQTTVGACYRLAASRFVKAIAAVLAAGALVMLCVGVPAVLGLLTGSSDLTTVLVFFAFIAVIVLGVRLSLVVQVIAIEGRGLNALARSIALTRGYFWKVISLTLLTSVVGAADDQFDRRHCHAGHEQRGGGRAGERDHHHYHDPARALRADPALPSAPHCKGRLRSPGTGRRAGANLATTCPAARRR